MHNTLDRRRLVQDLRRAAAQATLPGLTPGHANYAQAHGMARAFRIIAAAIEDGDYDVKVAR